MFAVIVFTLFAYSISKNAIECSTIRRESFVTNVKETTKRDENLTLLKKIDDALDRKKPKTEVMPNSKNKSKVEFNGGNFSTMPLLEKESRILISNEENLQPEQNVGRRKPKFFGSLGFLAGLSAAGLANAASENVHVLANILNSAVPIPIAGAPGYFAGFYKPQQYIPYSYPILYPVPNFINNYHTPVNGIPIIPGLMSQRKSNVTDGKIPEKSLVNETVQEVKETAETRTVLQKTIKPDENDENIDSRANNEDSELRQISGSESPTARPLKTSNSTTSTTTTAKPEIMNTTESSNLTEPVTPPVKTPGYLPFYGYYGGSPQDVSQVIFTTEDPQQRYLKDYTSDTLPFQRPAVAFNPYQNAEPYSNPFINSFSSGDNSYPDFLNTIDSDRYVYDSNNRPNFNGFRPILK